MGDHKKEGRSLFMFCQNCGKEIDDKAVVCIHCGAAVGQAQGQNQQQPQININMSQASVNQNANVAAGIPYVPKKKWTAFILCLLIGYFGIHRFYVGKNGSGILYLFTLGLCGIGWIVDLLLILSGSFRDKAGYPLVS